MSIDYALYLEDFDREMSYIPWILVPYETKSDLKIYVGQCDLYFKHQWFNPITQRLFDREMSYLRY